MFGFDDPFGTKKANTGRDPRRSFTASQKKELQYQQGGKCAICKKQLDPRDIEYDHRKAWADSGRTTVVNGRALCGSCHNKVSHGQHLKKVEKKPEKKPSDPLADALGMGGPKRGRGSDPLADALGMGRPKGKKLSSDPFAGLLGMGGSKKKGKDGFDGLI